MCALDDRPSSPATSLLADPAPPRRRGRAVRRLLVVALAGGVAAGGTLMLWPRGPHHRAAPAPAAGARAQAAARAAALASAQTAVLGGLPAALPDLTALIGAREALVRAHPRDAQAWAVLGAAYVERARRTADPGDYPRAERALQTSLKVAGKNNAEALSALAGLAVARRDFPAARRFGEEALKAAPKRWSAYPVLIDAYDGLGDYKAAGSALDRLTALKVGADVKPAVRARAAAVYRDRGWREDAVAQVTDAAAAARTPAEQAAYLCQAGQLAWERGDRDDALRHFTAAVRLDPEQSAARAGQGRALAALGRTQDALTAYQGALVHRPAPQVALELAELYESLGMGRQAEAQYELMRTQVRRELEAGVDDDLVIGQYEADHGDAQEAVERLTAEWERQPGIEVADALGWALHRAGDDKEALRYASIATDSTKGGGVRSAPYAFHRGMIERDLDLEAPARRHLQDALRFNPYFSPLQAPVAKAALTALGDQPPEEPLPG
ncbi:tetratricopeptide repeat protein [Streptomyces shenzhenensis]|uniref:tetratricopeptide repeat protein n=1 Tax=Streptomyces shenzhenensis TaxID=943815 RepID=UPI001F409925|nr:tetratricopeptide repeat protein [Streptomyces shenzhenensis]